VVAWLSRLLGLARLSGLRLSGLRLSRLRLSRLSWLRRLSRRLTL
jgi:hypothetical protein